MTTTSTDADALFGRLSAIQLRVNEARTVVDAILAREGASQTARTAVGDVLGAICAPTGHEEELSWNQ